MKISRWIYVPLIFVLIYSLQSFFVSDKISSDLVLYYAVSGAILGFVALYWSDSRARKLSNKDDEEIYQVRQNREFTMMLNFEKSFELGLEALNSLDRPAKIITLDSENGVIKAKTRMNWHSFGSIVHIKLNKLNENLTEVKIATRPIPRTALVDYGEGWKNAEIICRYLKGKDAELNQKILVESAEILNEVYVKPFAKEEIKR